MKEEIVTYAEEIQFWEYYGEYLANGCRKGQAMMNALFRVAPDLYDEIHGTPADCFYRDDLIVNFRLTVGM